MRGEVKWKKEVRRIRYKDTDVITCIFKSWEIIPNIYTDNIYTEMNNKNEIVVYAMSFGENMQAGRYNK